MKKNFTGRVFLPIIFLFLIACGNESSEKYRTSDQTPETVYTCPMHPEIRKSTKGNCPICGMDLVKAVHGNELIIDSSLMGLLKSTTNRITSTVSTIRAEPGTRIFSVPVQGIVSYDTRRNSVVSGRVSGRIERLYINYNFQPVKKGELLMEIYSPELVSAQRELLFVISSNSDPRLIEQAKQRLRLLGFQDSWINNLIRTKKPDYNVPVYSNASGYIVESNANMVVVPSVSSSSGSSSSMGNMGTENTGTGPIPSVQNNTPVLLRQGQYIRAGQPLFKIYHAGVMVAEFSIPPMLASEIKKGQNIVYSVQSDDSKMFSGSIGLVQPVQRPGENFTIARVYMNNNDLKAGQLLNANIPVVHTKGWWLPVKAVQRHGIKSVIFKREGNGFVPVTIQTGVIAQGRVQVMNDIGDWEIASNAAFLTDRESLVTGIEP